MPYRILQVDPLQRNRTCNVTNNRSIIIAC